jgi:hypothetical protein
MKLVLRVIALSLLVCCAVQSQTAATNPRPFPAPADRYFGQKPPGAEPEMFAPGIISRDGHFEHSAAVYSPDMREVYWSALDREQGYYKIYFIRFVNGEWTAPEVVPFLDENRGELGPAFSPDGNKLYFDMNRDIWVVEREGDGWSAPALVSEVSDSSHYEHICGVTADGSLFFIRYLSSPGTDELYVSRKTGGEYAKPEKLGKDFRSGYMRLGAVFVAPDESYMIIELQIDRGTAALFACYRMGDGSWSDIVELPLGWARFPFVTPDGKYIIFMRREGIYWASAAIIDELRPAELK